MNPISDGLSLFRIFAWLNLAPNEKDAHYGEENGKYEQKRRLSFLFHLITTKENDSQIFLDDSILPDKV